MCGRPSFSLHWHHFWNLWRSLFYRHKLSERIADLKIKRTAFINPNALFWHFKKNEEAYRRFARKILIANPSHDLNGDITKDTVYQCSILIFYKNSSIGLSFLSILKAKRKNFFIKIVSHGTLLWVFENFFFFFFWRIES